MHLSQKQNIFSHFICEFFESDLNSEHFESPLNFEHFKKKMTLKPYVFPRLPTTKEVLRSMCKNSPLRGPLDRRHGERGETLIQS